MPAFRKLRVQKLSITSDFFFFFLAESMQLCEDLLILVRAYYGSKSSLGAAGLTAAARHCTQRQLGS